MSTTLDLSRLPWRASSYSDGSGGSCVQVAHGLPGVLPVRDSKVPEGAVLVFPAASWTVFVDALRAGVL
ncbi:MULTISPECIES: DUF397 domain-containing protein [unclassified Streptomyces]|uniref:DUF397 domain-containing protein n=1 Tax=unclassified Streptomyces TaxID=2593676 RepID=UPI0034428191